MKFKTKVVHVYRDKYDVYIGRPGPFGNPFSHLPYANAKYIVATREEAVASFRNYFYNHRGLQEKVRDELRGKILGCYCKPLSCHGDVYVEFLEGGHV